jgi:O-antigen ligase
MLPAKSKVTRRLNRWLLVAAPVLVLYVMIGTGRTETIFKPVQAFASMGAGGQEDASTKARENENTSLITMIADRPLLGTGFGHEWVELDETYTVPVTYFPMYHYSPHNSILSLIAFCGGIGFAGLWLIIPIGTYLNARTYRRAPDPRARSVATVGIVEVVTYLNQAYGDMGAMGPTHIGPATILGAGMAVAARMSVASGAWPSRSAARAKA